MKHFLFLSCLSVTNALTCDALKGHYQNKECCNPENENKPVCEESLIARQYKALAQSNNRTTNLRIALFRSSNMADMNHPYLMCWVNRALLPIYGEYCAGGYVTVWLTMFKEMHVPGWSLTGKEIGDARVQTLFGYLSDTFELEYLLGYDYNQYSEKYGGFLGNSPRPGHPNPFGQYPVSEELWTAYFSPSGRLNGDFYTWARGVTANIHSVATSIMADSALGKADSLGGWGVSTNASDCVTIGEHPSGFAEVPPGTYCAPENKATFEMALRYLFYFHVQKLYFMSPYPACDLTGVAESEKATHNPGGCMNPMWRFSDDAAFEKEVTMNDVMSGDKYTNLVNPATGETSLIRQYWTTYAIYIQAASEVANTKCIGAPADNANNVNGAKVAQTAQGFVVGEVYGK